MSRTDYQDSVTNQTRLDTSFNEYYSIGGESQSHDDNGNLTDDGERKLQWDAFNRLCALLDEEEEPLVYYAYDATNRRVVKDGDVPAETHYVYAGWRVLEERDDSEALFRQFVWGNYLDEALVMDVNGGDDAYCTSFTLQQDPDARYYYLQNTL